MKRLQSVAKLGVFVLGALGLAGCSTTAVRWDATKLREQATAYYEDQIVDNLIRARNGQLFLHVNLSSLDASIASGMETTVGGGQTLTHSNSIDGIVFNAVRSAERPFTFGLTPSRTGTVTLNAAPVTEESEIYASYIRFLNLKEGQPLQEAKGKSINYSGVVSLVEKEKLSYKDNYIPGTLKKSGSRYYYIPREFQAAYQELCLALLKSSLEIPSQSAAKRSAAEPSGNKPKAEALEKLIKRNTQTLDQIKNQNLRLRSR